MKTASVACPARLRAFASALAAVAAALALVPASAAAFKGKVITIPGVSMLLNIACPPTGVCVATGLGTSPGFGFAPMVVVPISHGVPGTPAVIPGSGGVGRGLACPKANYCVAVAVINGADALLPISHGKPGTPVPLKNLFLGGLGCVGPNSCWGLGTTAATQTVLAHLAGTAVTHLYPLSSGLFQGTGEDRGPTPECVSATSCTLVGTANLTLGPGLVWSVKNGKITATRKVKAAQRLNEITCTSTTFCVVVGARVSPITREVSQGVLLTLNRGKPGPVRLAKGISDLSTVVCQTAASCFAFDNNDANAVVPIQHGKPAKTILIAPHVSDAVCSKASCLGVGTIGSGQSTQGILYRFT